MLSGKGRMLGTGVASVTDHGGSLDAGRALFPEAPGPWIDLSTGINPHAYPQLDLPTTAFTRLPEPGRLADLCSVAAKNYGAPSSANVVAAPGTQILLPRVAALRPPGKALILGPTYAEHIRAAAMTGHQASHVGSFDALFDADLAILVNPNNPDGRIADRQSLFDLARHLRGRGGLLVIDEAFMDVGPRGHSLAAEVEESGAVVLKSFGKFFGLAGVRLGFALAPRDIADRLAAELGPWAVAGPSLEYGIAGLADQNWQDMMRDRLTAEAATLDAILAAAGLAVTGGTSLFRFVETPLAQAVFATLGRSGILVRRFDTLPTALRFGLPAAEPERRRLAAALGHASLSGLRTGSGVIGSPAG